MASVCPGVKHRGHAIAPSEEVQSCGPLHSTYSGPFISVIQDSDYSFDPFDDDCESD